MSSPKQQQDTVSSGAEAAVTESWSKVTCPCCVSSEVEPLVLIQLAENVDPSTKQWIMATISACHKAGGERRLLLNPCTTVTSTYCVIPVCGHLPAAGFVPVC